MILFFLSCSIFLADNSQGGQPSLFLQVVNTPLVILVEKSLFIMLLPFNLGSLFLLSVSFLKLIKIFLPYKLFVFVLM